MKKNEGFSLLELIVAIAILSIAGIAIFGFISFGTRAFKNSNTEIKLQYEQQVAVNQIKDLVIEASYGLSYDKVGAPNYFYVFTTDSSDATKMKVARVRYDDSDKKLYLGSSSFDPSVGLTGVISHFTAASYDPSKEELLADDVEAFSVDLSNIKNLKVKLDFQFKVGEKSIKTSPVVALRNRITSVDSTTNLSKIIKNVETINSFIESITINRIENGKVIKSFAQNGTDSVLHAGKTVSAQYEAKVKATKNAIKDYSSVSWSLEAIAGGGDINGITVSQAGKVTIPGDTTAKKFKLIATSTDDPTKSASITIEISKTGKWAKSVELSLVNNKDGVPYPVKGNGTLTYLLDATVTYEVYKDGIKQPDEKVKGLSNVNVRLLDEKNPPVTAGAGWSDKAGTFLATKEMENKTYFFHVEAKDLGIDSNGNSMVVQNDTFSITVTGVPELIDSPIIAVDPNQLRGGTNGVSLSWKSQKGDSDEAYKPPFDHYDITWSLTKGNGWDENNTYYSFKNLYFKTTGRSYTDDGHKVEGVDNNQLYENVYCDPKLKWDKEFTFYVTALCKEKKDGKYTGREISATKTVTIKPVAVELRLSNDFSIKYNNNDLTDVIDKSFLIGTGKDHSPSGIRLGNNQQNYMVVEEYYKLFEPTLTGITVNSLNFGDVFGGYASSSNNLDRWNEDCYNISASSFKPYYFSGTTKKYYAGDRESIKAEAWKECGVHSIMGLDNNYRFFMGVKISPKIWINEYLSPKLYGLEYKVTLYGNQSHKDSSGNPINSVECKFVNEDGSKLNNITFRIENKTTKVSD